MKRAVAVTAATATIAALGAGGADAKTKSCGVKKLGGGIKAKVYVDKGNVSCQLATTTLRHADIRRDRKGWTCFRGNSHVEATPGGIGCSRKSERDIVSAVYIDQ